MMAINQNNCAMNLRLEYSSRPVSNSIKKAVEKIKEVLEIYAAVNKIVYNKPSIDDLIIEIKDSYDLMENILENFVEIYEDEYFYFTSIKSMLFYILDNKESLFYLPYVEKLSSSFCNLIRSKYIHSSEEYKIKQNKFDLELDNFEQKFFTEICKPSKHYDEKVLSGITNSLLDL